MNRRIRREGTSTAANVLRFLGRTVYRDTDTGEVFCAIADELHRRIGMLPRRTATPPPPNPDQGELW